MTETVACKYCGEQTAFTGTKECVNCHEVVSRLHKFLKSEKARIHTLGIFYKMYQQERDDIHRPV